MARGGGTRLAVVALMLPVFDCSPLPRRIPPLDADAERRVLDLPQTFARPIEDDADVANVVGQARHLVRTIMADDQDPRVAWVPEVDAWADILEHLDLLFEQGLRALRRARARLEPIARESAARHAPVLAIATHPRGSTDERALHEAAVWLGSLEAPSASRAIEVMRRERDVFDADDLRARAYNRLRQLLRMRASP